MFVFFFIILDRKSFIETKHNLFPPIFVYGIQYAVQFMVQNNKKILYKSCCQDFEWIKIIYFNSNGKNCVGFKTNHFLNSLLELIMFGNQRLTV